MANGSYWNCDLAGSTADYRAHSGMVATDPIADIRDACEATAMTDDDEARFDERVRKLVKHKPVPEKD